VRLRAALLASSALIAAPAAAQDATWVAAGPVADWNTNTNWAPATVPSGTATFNGAGSAGIVFTNAVTTVQTLNFTPGLQVYTFDICFCQEFRITGAGVVNPSAPAPVFAVDGGLLSFRNSSTSGNATVANVGGRVDFRQSSSAGTADITNRAGGVTTFGNESGAAHATITNRAFSATDFTRSSNAGHADITNNGGVTQFFNDANAASATITNRNSGGTLFFDMSKAGTATITNRDLSGTSFEDRSSADHADITNNGGITLFFNQAAAGSATITNRNGGATIFDNRTTADDATITTRTGSFVQFFGRSTGGNARFITDAGGEVDWSDTKGLANDGRISAGSIEGGGTYFIGAGNNLSVGGNNLSTQVSGIIADFNPCGCATPGSGALTKVGTGTMILSGLNTYTGGTTFKGGTVSVSQEANLGAIAGPLTFDGGILQITGTTFHSTARSITWGAGGGGFDIANAANTFTVNQVLGGPGSLTKLGPGTLVLSGANGYGGGTTVAGGTLSISANNNIGTGPLSLLNGTTLQLTGSFNFTHPTSVAGNPTFNVTAANTVAMSASITDGAMPGELVKIGTGTLILAANNTYTGGTIVSAGTLQLGNGGASGSIFGNVLNNANFAINRSDVFAFDGLISGSGAVQQNGTGTTVFIVNNTYAGGTTINAGTLQLGNGGTSGAILGNVIDNAILAFNRANAYSFDGVISGTGAVQQNGTGTTIFNTTHSYTGATSVNAGTLTVNGSIASSSGLTVNAGGTVGGTGNLPSTTMNGGTLSPGNSIGTITINGNLAFVGPGTYLVEVSPTTADKTIVAGSATLAGTVSAVFAPGLYAQQHYTILTASGGLSGTFSNLAVTNAPAYLTAGLSYTATDVLLNLTSGIAQLTGLTPNQRATGGAIDTAFNSGTPPAGLLGPLFGLSAASMPHALTQLSGEVHASAAGVLVDESLYPRSAVLGRLRQAAYGGDAGMASLAAGGPQAFAAGEELSALAYGKSPIVTKAPPIVPQPGYDVVFWAQGFGASGRFDSDGNAASVRRDLAGFFSGADTRVGTNGRVGIAAGYTGSRNNLDGRGAANVETGHLMGYGGWNFGSLNLRAGGAYAWHTIDTSRTAAFPGFLDTLTAHYDGRTGQIFGEAGYGFAFGKVAVEPFAGGAWVHLATDGTTERGGAAALMVAANSFDVGYSTLGVRAASMIPFGHDMVLVPRASAAWQHAFNNVTPEARLAFIAAPVPFVVAGVPIARDSLLGEAGLDLAIGRNATVGVSYVGQLARNVHDHAAKGKFSWKF
jgi:outer membrane autotransporter protein